MQNEDLFGASGSTSNRMEDIESERLKRLLAFNSGGGKGSVSYREGACSNQDTIELHQNFKHGQLLQAKVGNDFVKQGEKGVVVDFGDELVIVFWESSDDQVPTDYFEFSQFVVLNNNIHE